jgi:hypothetical protein
MESKNELSDNYDQLSGGVVVKYVQKITCGIGRT